MAGTPENDPFGVVPDGFCDAWGADTIPEALAIAEGAPGTTPNEEKPRCNEPGCWTTRLHVKTASRDIPNQVDTKYRCYNGHHFDDPRPPIGECPREYALKWLDDQQRRRGIHIKTMPINTGFEWCTDLKDPDERTPVLSQLDDETLTALAIRAYEPWRDGGPSYREIASVMPYSRWWVGERVRAWGDGEHRDLVPDPTTGRDGEHRDLVGDPTADTEPESTAEPRIDPAVAVERIGGDYRELVAERTPDDAASAGGSPAATDGGRETSRWRAYGSD